MQKARGRSVGVITSQLTSPDVSAELKIKFISILQVLRLPHVHPSDNEAPASVQQVTRLLPVEFSLPIQELYAVYRAVRAARQSQCGDGKGPHTVFLSKLRLLFVVALEPRVE